MKKAALLVLFLGLLLPRVAEAYVGNGGISVNWTVGTDHLGPQHGFGISEHWYESHAGAPRQYTTTIHLGFDRFNLPIRLPFFFIGLLLLIFGAGAFLMKRKQPQEKNLLQPDSER